MKTNHSRNALRWTVDQWERPAGRRGGDFVATHHDARRLRIFVGDVAGHGDEVAGHAERARRLIQPDLAGPIDEATLRRWNRRVFDALEDRFVAFTLLDLDIQTGCVSLLCGGNPGVVVLRADRPNPDWRCIGGMPLGLVDDSEWQPAVPVRFNVRPADAIVCFTDGLPDSLGGPDHQRYGLPRVLSTLARSRRRDPLPMLRRSIESFADPRAEQDDVTVLWAGDARRRAA